MSTNGQLVFTDVDKITFKGVGNTSNAVVDTVTGKIGVGIDNPDANLHVLGNSYVSTNLELGGTLIMGTVNVSAHHSLEAVTATGNTTPLTVEFTNPTTSLVTSGNVEVGKELTVTGNATVSSNLTVSGNVEVGTANLFVDTVNSRVGIGETSPSAKLTVAGTNNTYDPIFRINGWKTLTWSGNNVAGDKDVTIVTHDGANSSPGVIGGIVEVICHRGGFGQQRAYAKFHVNYSYWTSDWRGHFDALEKDMGANTTDITIVTSNSPVKIDVRITSPSSTLGQYYIKFHGPIYNQS